MRAQAAWAGAPLQGRGRCRRGLMWGIRYGHGSTGLCVRSAPPPSVRTCAGLARATAARSHGPQSSVDVVQYRSQWFTGKKVRHLFWTYRASVHACIGVFSSSQQAARCQRRPGLQAQGTSRLPPKANVDPRGSLGPLAGCSHEREPPPETTPTSSCLNARRAYQGTWP